MSIKKWKLLSSEYLSNQTWFTVRRDRCITDEGKIIDPYFVFEFPEWATAFPLTTDGKVILVKQYRHALGVISIELPGGCIDTTDHNAEAGIRRELLEETGYEFDEVIALGNTSPNPSTNSNLMHMFLMKGGRKVQSQQLDHNEEIEVLEVSVDELKELIQHQKIIQSMHLTTIFYALQFLNIVKWND